MPKKKQELGKETTKDTEGAGDNSWKEYEELKKKAMDRMEELRDRLNKFAKEWRLKTISTDDGWYSREVVGQMIYDYIENNPEWEPWAARITGMIMEREDMIVSATMDNREILDDNILRAREVLKTDGWVLVTKKNGEKSILRVEKRIWGGSSEEDLKTDEDRERRRVREESSDEDDQKKAKRKESEESIAHLVGTCLGENKQEKEEDKPAEPTKQTTETERPKDEVMEIPKEEIRKQDIGEYIGEEEAESEMIKEEDEEESGETSLTETAGGYLIPRRDKQV